MSVFTLILAIGVCLVVMLTLLGYALGVYHATKAQADAMQTLIRCLEAKP